MDRPVSLPPFQSPSHPALCNNSSGLDVQENRAKQGGSKIKEGEKSRSMLNLYRKKKRHFHRTAMSLQNPHQMEVKTES